MKKAFKAGFAIVLILCWAAAGAAAAARAADGDRFIEALGDVPLMPGFEVDGDSVVSFDSPTGRIVRVSAHGRAGPDAVRTFYRESLPNLGWRTAGPDANLYRREGEALTLDIARRGGRTVVRYGLAPAAQ